MSKKVLVCLLPVLVVAALAVLPSAARATLRWYKNGVLVPEGEKVPTIAWGPLTLSNLNIGAM